MAVMKHYALEITHFRVGQARAGMQFTLFVRAASHAWLDGAGAFFALIDSV